MFKETILFCALGLFFLLFCSTIKAQDDCQMLHNKSLACEEYDYVGHMMDYDVCLGYTDQSACESAGCFWYKGSCVTVICSSDSTYDGKVDLSDLVLMKKEFNRSGCPAYPWSQPAAAPVPKTHQLIAYNDYDDGYLQKGVPWFFTTRFTDNGDGTVKDNLTGLIWLKDANCQDAQASDWWGALNAYFLHGTCGGTIQGVCGLTDNSCGGDWRLPNIKELLSLIDYDHYVPDALPHNHPFINVQTMCDPYCRKYLSSTTNAGNHDFAWTITFSIGVTSHAWKNESYFVWPVRGPVGPYVDPNY